MNTLVYQVTSVSILVIIMGVGICICYCIYEMPIKSKLNIIFKLIFICITL